LVALTKGLPRPPAGVLYADELCDVPVGRDNFWVIFACVGFGAIGGRCLGVVIRPGGEDASRFIAGRVKELGVDLPEEGRDGGDE